jgi:hypothetical protein
MPARTRPILSAAVVAAILLPGALVLSRPERAVDISGRGSISAPAAVMPDASLAARRAPVSIAPTRL